MFKSLTIGDTEYKLPADYSCKKWAELTDIGVENIVQFVSVGFDIPIDKVKELPADILEMGAGYIMLLLAPIAPKSPYKPMNFNDMTLGQFIDCEVAIEARKKDIQPIAKVIFKEDIDDDTPISRLWPGYLQYMNYRNLLYYNYKELFNIDDKPKEAGEVKQRKTRSNAHIWYDLVMLLADGKFLNIDSVANRPVVEAFNWLAWNKDKHNEQLAAEREARQKVKNQRNR